jgi:hypothetical protein
VTIAETPESSRRPIPTRRQVVDAVQKTDTLKLSAGTYGFDQNGNPTSATRPDEVGGSP